MDTKALKDKILQLAIQGKLVPQDENDEPASVLLERIKERKKELIKERNIKKSKVNKESYIEDTLVKVPKSWVIARLGEISLIKTGRLNSSDSDECGEYPFFTCGAEVLKTIDYEFDCDAILLGGNNATGNFKLHQYNGKFNAYQRVYVIENIIAVKEYIYYCVRYNLQVLQQISIGTATKYLKLGQVESIVIPLPPIEEQKRIVEKLNVLFKLIDELDNNKQDLLQNISDSRNKVLQLAIQGKLVSQDENDESASVLLEKIKEEKQQLIKDKVIRKEKPLPEILDDEKIFEIPNGWEWCRLGDIGIYKKGPFGSTITKSMFVPKSENTVKVYEQKNAIQKDWTLGEYYVTKEYFEAKLKGFEVVEGDIIVSCAGTIGETYIMPSGIEKGVINQALMKMKIFEGVNVDYFLMYFDCILKETSKASSKGSAIKNIPPFDIFKKMLLPLPPLKEQKRIVAKVNIIMNYLDMLEKQMN